MPQQHLKLKEALTVDVKKFVQTGVAAVLFILALKAVSAKVNVPGLKAVTDNI